MLNRTLVLIGLSLFLQHGHAEESHSVDFNKQIRPILTRYCSACHGGVKQAGDVSFVYASSVLPPDGWIVEPGDPDSSVLIERIKTEDADLRMPPPDEHPDPLPAKEIALLEQWIREGAKWGDHWSLAPLADGSGSRVASSGWPRQPLDQLVEDRHVQADITPSIDALPAEWLRRVSFDLTGLPPTLEQTYALLARCQKADGDDEIDAIYSREVDRLLASQSFGERWASVWMDLARYADSKGFEKDPHRDMWPYRDWLIRAFNDDLPYDQFTIKQLAGDLLDGATADDLIATAFHRNTQTNTEGGTDDEEFRVAAVIDRINTTWTVWQATTFGCVQCHSHPYDPLKQEEYYACMALFNNTRDTDLDSDYPTLKIPNDPEQLASAVALQQRFESMRRRRNRLGSEVARNADWQPLEPSKATASDGQLRIDGTHVRSAGGTFPVGVSYTFEADAASMTALKIEILPESDDPSTWPEQGSVLTQLKVSLVQPDGNVKTVELADVFVDALSGPDDPRSCLEKNQSGVGGYPKLHRPRWAAFVLRERLAGSDAKLRLEMVQSARVTGNVATPLRNFRWSVCDDDVWLELMSSQRLTKATKALDMAKRDVDAIKGVGLPVARSRDTHVARATRLFIRGNWLERGDEIPPGIPSVFAEPNGGETPQVRNRLEFARWLVSAENPLAARVWANRIWSQLFERGLVETLEDFGSSGLQPSHPRLLDHLAMRLRDTHQWRLKPLLREIVLSSTYRQTNQVEASLRENDPDNVWLARGPRTRLPAEMIRDQALTVSGLLSREVGGPSVMPPQPEGVWQTVYSGAKWNTAEGAQRYRRALYTYWRRTSPYPSFLMFDSPTRDLCSARRISTNTPLQALVTLNDPVYVECSEALANRATTIAAKSSEAINWMYRAVTQRSPTAEESSELESLYADLSAGEPKELINEIDTASLSIVASTILNLDRALTK